MVLDMQRTKREKEFERETRRERREKEQLSSRKKHKRAKNGKRGKREKKTKVKEQTERKFSLLLCFFFVRESCSFSRLSSLRSLTRSSKKNRHFKTVGKKRSTKHAKSNVSLISAGEEGRVIQMRRIGLGWLPGASIGVLSGFFIFNEPLREFHAVKEKKNTLKSTEKKNENNSRSEE